VFLSRLTEKKGLHHLIGYLATQPAQVRLDIIGPDEEPGYWARCAALIAQLPGNIVVEKHAPMPPGEAMAWLQAAHAFAMPTHGENFGHAIFEAFCAGRPVLISDQTPWQGLAARHLGWDIPLKDEAAYGAALTAMSGMDQAEWNVWAHASWDFAAATIAETGLVDAQVAMVEAVLASAAEADLLAQGERDL
jgi:glycosyltransferase involved in cell wall biosynthesis